MSTVAKIVIVEEYRMYAEALHSLFSKQCNVQLVNILSNSDELHDFLENNPIDIVLLDLDTRELAGFELSRRILKDFPRIKIIAFTSFVKPMFVEFAIFNGIKGFVDKRDSFEKLTDVVRIVHNGGSVYPEPFSHLSEIVDHSPLDCLSPREKEVARLMLFGRTTKQIGKELFIGYKTVETHRTKIYRKLEIGSLDELKAITLHR